MCLDYIKLNEYYDNALEVQEINLVEDHLVSCSKCRLAVNNIMVISKTIAILPKASVNSKFVDDLINKIIEIDHPGYEELNDYCDNNISGFAYNKISEHIEACDKCKDTVNSINISSTPYFEQFEFKASNNFLDNIFAKIDIAESQSISEIIYEPVLEKFFTTHLSITDISAYIDNQAVDNLSKFEEHISECQICDNKLKMFSLAKSTVMNLAKPVIPFNFSKNVVKIIESEHKVITLSSFMRKFIPAAAMVAGLLIVGTFFGVDNSNLDNSEQVASQPVNITVRSEEMLFSPQSQVYRTDSIGVLSDTSQDNSLLVEDIGL